MRLDLLLGALYWWIHVTEVRHRRARFANSSPGPVYSAHQSIHDVRLLFSAKSMWMRKDPSPASFSVCCSMLISAMLLEQILFDCLLLVTEPSQKFVLGTRCLQRWFQFPIVVPSCIFQKPRETLAWKEWSQAREPGNVLWFQGRDSQMHLILFYIHVFLLLSSIWECERLAKVSVWTQCIKEIKSDEILMEIERW